jgi:hypothetical protein
MRNPIDGKRVILARFPLSIRNKNDQERERSHQGEKSKIGQLHNLLPPLFAESNARSGPAFRGQQDSDTGFRRIPQIRRQKAGEAGR